MLDETAEFLDDNIVVDPTNAVDEDAETILRASASLAEGPAKQVVVDLLATWVSRPIDTG